MSEYNLNPTSNINVGLQVAQTANVLIWISNTEKECVYFNNAWLNFRGRSLEQEYGYGWADGVHPDDYDRCIAIFTKAFDARESFSMDYRLKHVSGEFRWISDDGMPHYEDNGEFTGFIGTCFDITARVNAEKETLEVKAKFQSLVESVPTGIYLTDEKGICTYMNPYWQELLDIDNDDVIAHGWASVIHPEDNESVVANWKRLIKGKDTFDVEYRINTQNNNEIIVHDVATNMNDANGNVIGFIGTVIDITEQRDLKNHIHQSEKIEAIGQLAGGVAHDFNNQLTGILGNTEILSRRNNDEALERYITNINSAANNAKNLTTNLLTYSRQTESRLVFKDIHLLIEETIELLIHSIDKRIIVNKDLRTKHSTTEIDPTPLQNAFLNLGLNARDAMPEGGVLTFKTETLNLDSESSNWLGVKPGSYILISVIDNGIGITEANKSHLFEAYFTTKNEGEGTGLGLASAYGTIKQHNGHIFVESKVGEGTCFQILLPVCKNENVSAELLTKEPLLSSKSSLNILLADDEQLIRELCTEILIDEGHSVVSVDDGKAMLDYYIDNWESIDLVVIDMNMPRLDGLSAFKSMKNINPEIKAVVNSGFSEPEDLQEIKAEGICCFVQKPFKIKAFLEIIYKAVK